MVKEKVATTTFKIPEGTENFALKTAVMRLDKNLIGERKYVGILI